MAPPATTSPLPVAVAQPALAIPLEVAAVTASAAPIVGQTAAQPPVLPAAAGLPDRADLVPALIAPLTASAVAVSPTLPPAVLGNGSAPATLLQAMSGAPATLLHAGTPVLAPLAAALPPPPTAGGGIAGPLTPLIGAVTRPLSAVLSPLPVVQPLTLPASSGSGAPRILPALAQLPGLLAAPVAPLVAPIGGPLGTPLQAGSPLLAAAGAPIAPLLPEPFQPAPAHATEPAAAPGAPQTARPAATPVGGTATPARTAAGVDPASLGGVMDQPGSAPIATPEGRMVGLQGPLAAPSPVLAEGAKPAAPGVTPQSASLTTGRAVAAASAAQRPGHLPAAEPPAVQGSRSASGIGVLRRLAHDLGASLRRNLLPGGAARGGLQRNAGSGATSPAGSGGARSAQGSAATCRCDTHPAAVLTGPPALLLVLDPPVDANPALPPAIPSGAGGSVGSGAGGLTGLAALAALLLLAALWKPGPRLHHLLTLPQPFAFAPVPPPG